MRAPRHRYSHPHPHPPPNPMRRRIAQASSGLAEADNGGMNVACGVDKGFGHGRFATFLLLACVF